MSTLIAHASINEHGQIKGGQAGDQTGKEVCIREWYSKPWSYVIRFKDEFKAEKVAKCMENASKNDRIGYSQYTRNTLLKEARKFNYDVSRVTTPCECDCSSLVSVACMYAGIPESKLTLNGNCATTRTLRPILKSTGLVDVYSSAPYVSKTDRLKRGDILLSEGHHVACVVQVDKPQLLSLDEIAKEVIAGKWGSGLARRAKLTDAGYDYNLVQARVNELLKPKLSIDEVAKEVIQGKWGKGLERKQKLTNAGYDYNLVQARVNEMLKHKPVEITDKPKFIWDYLMLRIDNPYGVAGLMGNIQAESGFNPKNMQNSFEKKLGLNDDTYTAAVDSGAYGRFAEDGCGFGICQWSHKSRKAALLEFKGNRSIGDLEMQCDFLWKELTYSYRLVLEGLKTAFSVREASDLVLKKFERPSDQSDAVKAKRASMGQEIFDKYSK